MDGWLNNSGWTFIYMRISVSLFCFYFPLLIGVFFIGWEDACAEYGRFVRDRIAYRCSKSWNFDFRKGKGREMDIHKLRRVEIWEQEGLGPYTAFSGAEWKGPLLAHSYEG